MNSIEQYNKVRTKYPSYLLCPNCHLLPGGLMVCLQWYIFSLIIYIIRLTFTVSTVICSQVELWSASKTLVFQSAGGVLFGTKFFQRHGPKAVQETFFGFEESFEVRELLKVLECVEPKRVLCYSVQFVP
jgi:hypothetical protein